MPSAYRQLEFDIRSVVQRTLQRGKVDLNVAVESSTVEGVGTINREIFRSYLQQSVDALSFSASTPITTHWFRPYSACRASYRPETETLSDEERAALMSAVDEALRNIDAFRRQEGDILIKDLLERVDKIEAYKAEVEPYEKMRRDTIRNRIRENLAQLPVEVDDNRLEQEMIFYIEKLDITEEKVRLSNHCRYFREVAASEQGAGRKLGFIAQEMGREINTLGSKANESNMQILVVKMKDELEKIKEQVLNIL